MHIKNQAKDKKLWIFALVVLAVAIAASAVIWGERLKVESAYKDVQVAVNIDDMESLANAKNLSMAKMAEELQTRGVSVVLFKEKSVSDLERVGKIEMALGTNVKNLSYSSQLPKDLDVRDTDMYLVILDKSWEDQIVKNLEEKVAGVTYYPGEISVAVIPAMLPSSALELSTLSNEIGDIGLGWDQAQIKETAELGFGIMPQVRSWSNATDESLKYVTAEIKQMPNLYAFLFNDKEIIGYQGAQSVRVLATLLEDEGGNPIAPVATIEFNDQKGINQLGQLLNKEVVRLHTISNSEMSKFEAEGGMEAALDRWMLAARERNMRTLLVRFFDINSPAASFDRNMHYLEELQTNLTDSGFSLGSTEYTKMSSVGNNTVLNLLVGLGVAAGMMILLLVLGSRKLAIAGFAAVIVCYGACYLYNPVLARKLMALASVIIYPIIGCTVMMEPKHYNLASCIGRVLMMCAISFLGAIFMVGLLSDTSFMLKLDGFAGVKIAHVIPIAAVPFILFILNDEHPLNVVKEILDKAVTYKWGILAAVLAVCGYIYISRTGNTTAELSTAESTMRQTLTDILGVRPRSKEFLIGYPFTMLLFYLGASKKNWVLTLPAVIGQVSLVNTYAHIHTPLLISLHRSFNGLALGLLIGIIAIAGVKCVDYCRRRYLHE